MASYWLGAMIVALLLALEYKLFSFIAELSGPQRKISLAEAIFLTVLLALRLNQSTPSSSWTSMISSASTISTATRLEIASCKSSPSAFARSVGPSDLLARLGGDEFALLCYDVNRDTATAIARRLLASLEGEIRLGGHSYRIGASIGAALIPDDGEEAEEIIHHADLAMYRAKGQDHSSVVFFEPSATYRQQISTTKT